jgi:transcriptional regulator of acetoin/glycerol metabolism
MDNSDRSFELIKKSRKLYFEKGSLRRYCLRDEIANSWIKFNLLKNQDLELTNSFSKKGRSLKLVSESLSKILEKYNYKVHILLDNDHIYDFSFKKTREYYSTGAEIAFKLKKDFTVFKEEHISEKFDDSFTHGFFVKEEGSVEYILGVYGSYKDYSEVKIKEIRNLIHEEFVNRNNKKSQHNFIDYEKKYSGISHYYLPVVLIGDSGTGKKFFVRKVHEKYYSKRQLKIIDCKEVIDINEYLNIKSNCLLYLKNIEWLTYKNQVKVATYIDSKLVNSETNNTSNKHNITLFFSATKVAIEEVKKEWIDRRLLTRLTANNIYFKSVRNHNSKRLFQIIENETNRLLTDQTKEIIREFSWENNWNDVKKMIEYINEYSNKLEIELVDLPKFIADRNAEIPTIKDAEKKLIKKSLKVFDENVTLASKALGVSRSTLYRKLKEYNLS